MTPAFYDPGRLRHHVVVESAAGAPDGAGGEAIAWDAVATLWALVEPVAAGERIVAGHLSSVVTHTVTMRYRPDIAGGMRILHRGRALRVLAVHDPDERRRYSVARCAEERP